MAKIHVNHDCLIQGHHVPAGEQFDVPDEAVPEFIAAGAHLSVVQPEPESEPEPTESADDAK